jgi:hypothetical protein
MNTQINYKLRIGNNIIEGISTENNTDTTRDIKRLINSEVKNILDNISLIIEKDGKEYNVDIYKRSLKKVNMVTKIDGKCLEGIRKDDLVVKPFDEYHLAMREDGKIDNKQIKNNLKTFGYIDKDDKYTEKGKAKREILMFSPLPNKARLVYNITQALQYNNQVVISEWAINKEVTDKGNKITDIGNSWIRKYLEDLFRLSKDNTSYQKWLLQFLTLGELATFLTHDNKDIRCEAVYYTDKYIHGQSIIGAAIDGNLELVKKVVASNSEYRLLNALYKIAKCIYSPFPEIQQVLIEHIREERININTIVKSENISLIDMVANIVPNIIPNYGVNPSTLIKALEIDCSIETIQKLTNKLGYWDAEIITTAINKGDVDVLKIVLTGRKGKVDVALSSLPNDIQQVLTEHNAKY